MFASLIHFLSLSTACACLSIRREKKRACLIWSDIYLASTSLFPTGHIVRTYKTPKGEHPPSEKEATCPAQSHSLRFFFLSFFFLASRLGREVGKRSVNFLFPIWELRSSRKSKRFEPFLSSSLPILFRCYGRVKGDTTTSVHGHHFFRRGGEEIPPPVLMGQNRL